MVRTKGDMKGPTKDELRRQIAEKDAEIARLRAVGIDPDEWHKRLAAAYERGAREFAEWLPNIELAIREDHDPYVAKCMTIMDGCAIFLASRGTGIAESKGEEG